MATEELTYEYAFAANHEGDESPEIVVRVNAGALARDGRVELCLADAGATTGTPPTQGRPGPAHEPGCCDAIRLRVLDPVRVETEWCGCRTVVALEPGSEVTLGGRGAPAIRKLSGAQVVRPGCVRLTRPSAVLVLAQPARTRQNVRLYCTYPQTGRQRYAVHVSRLDPSGRSTGGVTMVLGPEAS